MLTNYQTIFLDGTETKRLGTDRKTQNTQKQTAIGFTYYQAINACS